jgi:hypothetical protein
VVRCGPRRQQERGGRLTGRVQPASRAREDRRRAEDHAPVERIRTQGHGGPAELGRSVASGGAEQKVPEARLPLGEPQPQLDAGSGRGRNDVRRSVEQILARESVDAVRERVGTDRENAGPAAAAGGVEENRLLPGR